MNARGHIRECIPLFLTLVFLAVGTIDSAVRAQTSKLRILFYGYVETKPRVASGIIEGDRLVDVADAPFPWRGAEISPDGQLVAFDTCRKADRGLNIARIDGSDERRLVDLDGDSCVDIRWSRDGARLSYGSPIDRRLHIVELGSGVDIPLQYTSPAYGWHAWSPAGDAIAYEVGRGGSRRIDIIDVSTSRTRELVGKKQFGDCEVWAPDWSPTNDRIVFTTCKRELYVVSVDGTGLARLAGSAYAPRWAPDGTSVYFLMGNRLMHVSASGGAAQRLGVSPYYGGPFSIGPAQ
jgi:Tol biopolymer transport system component